MTRFPFRLAVAALTATAGLAAPVAFATAAQAATVSAGRATDKAGATHADTTPAEEASGGVRTLASYDTVYDDSSLSLSTVACSDGKNGLLTKGFTTLGSLPSFPYVMGSAEVAGWNSPMCGTAWEITDPSTGRSIYAVAVDHAPEGVTLSEEAMNALTDGKAADLGRVSVEVKQAPLSKVGM